jgi:hypothetical protein
MINKSNLSTLVAIVITFAMFIPVALAETPYDITNCYYGTFTRLYKDKDLTISTLDIRGICRSNHENKVLDDASFHNVQIMQIMKGKRKRYGHTKFIDKDGDYIVGEITGGNTAIVNLIYGTGKWKGITGSGKFEVISRGKSMEPGTFHGCVRNTGTFELPKK